MMGRYFFHLWLGDVYECDDVGLECADAEEAYLQAFLAAQDGWIDQVHQRTDPRRHRFEVADATGAVLFELPFTEVMNRPAGVPAALLPIVTSTERNAALVAEVAHQVSRAADNIRKSRSLLAQLDASAPSAKR
jgi:hypothetical protein